MSSLEGSAELLRATAFSVADVRSPGGPSSLPAQDASSCIRTIQDLFAAPTALKEEEPSPKRRKSRNGNAIPVRPQADSNEKNSVVLANVSIDLVSRLVDSYGVQLTCL